ncbi:hypothetical protein WMY93_001116 [Mugilogobius chulae]|uniref:PUM-HD domain-containing protein n=1 Tax=Mugilogobius chulae TaxID=88201 RepID=A0AAW0Q2W7_9GOBI
MVEMDKEQKTRKKGEKKRKHTSESADGGQKKRKNVEDGEEKRGKTRLDPTSVGYFRRVDDRLKEGFEDDETKEMFVENVLSEVRGKAALVALDRTASITLQHLLPLTGLDQVAELLKEMAGETGSDIKAVACSQCGSHVLESAIRQMSRWAESTQEEEDDSGPLETQVLCLSGVIRESCAEFIKHIHGTHTVRTLLHVMAGCIGPPRTTAQPAANDRHVTPELTDFDIPTSFWYELKELTESLMASVNLSVTNSVASAVFQTMLTVCHRKRPKLCKQLLKRIMEYMSSCSSSPGVSPLLVFLKDQAASRLIEKVIQLSHKALLRDIFKNHLKGHLVDLALHPIANFVIQRLTAATAKYKMFVRLFDELLEGVEAILAAGHMGVIVQMAESCAENGERQDELMRCLLSAFHCDEPGSRHTSCLPLFLSLLTYEVYYHSDTAEGGIDTQAPLKSSLICYHGSRLVQGLTKFKERSLLLSSLRTLSPDDLLTLATDPMGSHVLQALITTSSDKGRGKILKRLEGQFVPMACSRSGSRALEAIWNSASVTHRQNIAEELAPSESQLRSDQFARHVWAKFALSHFTHRRAHWHEIQTGESKKRKMFSDILE